MNSGAFRNNRSWCPCARCRNRPGWGIQWKKPLWVWW